jgi:hypothetical protein
VEGLSVHREPSQLNFHEFDVLYPPRPLVDIEQVVLYSKRQKQIQRYCDSLKNVTGLRTWTNAAWTKIEMEFTEASHRFDSGDSKKIIDSPPLPLPLGSEIGFLGSIIGDDEHIMILPISKTLLIEEEWVEKEGCRDKKLGGVWLKITPPVCDWDIYDLFEDLSEDNQVKLKTRCPTGTMNRSNRYTDQPVGIWIPLNDDDYLNIASSEELNYIVLKKARMNGHEVQKMLETLCSLGALSFDRSACYKMLRQVIALP